ncbi:MAG: cation:proton antiporter [Paludibacteraceae bacterium]|nr:cation:proton antiporter [Paludibacteraceae bacterium]
MESIPTLISDLSLILLCAALMSIIFKKLKQPVVLGYIMAGFLAGPYMPFTSTIVDMASIKTWADIGVIFLMFGLGLEFSFKKLLKIGTAPVVAVITMLLCMLGLGLLVAHGFGWSKMDGLYLGGMMAIASTSIIVKSFEELGVKQEKFTTTVFGILILEDIIAIILMLLFGTLGKGGSVDGEVLIMSLVSMAFYLVLWFILGIYLIPLLLKKSKKFLNNETLLIISLALCFMMVVAASAAGFSAAFGAFVMGSILAETTEGEHIEHITTPIKNLFGAIFFVSVGMMIDPSIIVKYWGSILTITAVVLILGSFLDTFACMLGGVNFKEAIRCGFSLAQVGEFAFIIASLGVSLGAIEPCLYPIIVSVSVITTFTSPYMIKASGPIAEKLEPLLPEKLRRENRRNANASDTHIISKPWMNILKQSAVIILIYAVLCATVIALCDEVVYPQLLVLLDDCLPDTFLKYATINEIAKLVTVLIALFGLLVFIRPLLTKGLFDDKFWALWHNKQFNRAPLIFIIGLRGLVAVIMVTTAVDVIYHSPIAALVGLVVFAILYWVLLRQIKKGQSHMESVFKENYNSKEMAAKADRPTYEGDLLSKDVHLSEIKIPVNSVWCGKTIKEADWGRTYHINIASILRNSGRINIPSPDAVIFPNDRVQLLGSDENLKKFATDLSSDSNKVKVEANTPDSEMQLLRIAVPENSVIIGKKIFDIGIRDDFHCMIAGIDRGDDNLIKPSPDVVFCGGDIVWIVGESKNIKNLQQHANKLS